MDSLATTLLFAVILLGQVRLFCGVILRKCVNIHTTLSDIVILPPWVILLTYIILRVRVFSSTVTWTNVDLSSKVFCGIHLIEISHKRLINQGSRGPGPLQIQSPELLWNFTWGPNGPPQNWIIDSSRYYYSHLVAARGHGSRQPPVRVVCTNMTKECEVKCKYHWDMVQNKYENLMMLHIWILCGKDLFKMGIYHLIQTKIYFTVCISMYVKPSVPACTWLILQRPLTDGCSNVRSVYW